MNSRRSQASLANRSAYSIIAIASVALIVPASREMLAQTPPATESAEVTPNAAAQEAAPKIPDADWILSSHPSHCILIRFWRRRWLLLRTRSKSSSFSSG
jgi:hypothetical protein